MLADWTYAFQDWPTYLSAAWLSLKLSLAAFALACALGLLGALARRSRHALVRAPAAVYVEVIRNTPVLLQMFVAYFALPSAGLRLSPVQAGIAALGVNVGAYLTEIFRAGIQAVPRGQREASRVLALTPFRTYLHVVLPQALRNVYPAVVNQLVQIILGSSLLSAISVPELTGTAMVINSRNLLTIQVFGIAAVLYLVLTNLVVLVAGLIGRAAFKPPLRPVSTRQSALAGLRTAARRLVLVRKEA
ncbi:MULTISPECIES: amino acid ABC transporter permease [Streptomyces]|uniref:amino acid ABC transporter permease n=1 Tax=Streptomyces TaxID=1883 RepID=UPI00168A5F5A|nr:MULTISPECIES: amino acid ABC transporter permease [unclassified Streptomyces]MBD3009083.1 amino acid ABC transporter permease [Streptomyces sp. 5-10]